ncbi:hypothetical protein DL96DRAFT_1037169 [Flagelloscypha sp. PMI_526]|nr:hypothetical protein DL96DRAFT_1037169 [Flagelloscypha sp. PMI_526]
MLYYPARFHWLLLPCLYFRTPQGSFVFIHSEELPKVNGCFDGVILDLTTALNYTPKDAKKTLAAALTKRSQLTRYKEGPRSNAKIRGSLLLFS